MYLKPYLLQQSVLGTQVPCRTLSVLPENVSSVALSALRYSHWFTCLSSPWFQAPAVQGPHLTWRCIQWST